MSDLEFITFLCEQIFGILVEGNNPDLDTIGIELAARDINYDEIFGG